MVIDNLKHMRIFRAVFLLVLLATVSALFCIHSASAQDYQFQIPENLVIFWVEPDGTVSISYDFVIQNSGKPLDYIDIGAPNNNFDISNVIASINSRTVDRKNILRIDYQETGIPYGVTIDNTAAPIPRNQQAEVYVEIPGISKVLFTASEKRNDQEYVSFQFSPAYFSPDFTMGTTSLTVRLVLPQGITEQDGVYFEPRNWPGLDQPESWFNQDGNMVYEWKSDIANSRTEYIFGAMFPRSALPADVQIQSEAQARANSSSSGSNSKSVLLTVLIVIGLFIFGLRKNKKGSNRLANNSYLPPKIKAEGEGIKRGLTSIEAGILLEQPMDKIISMIIFSLVKKGAVEVKSEKPLEILVSDPLPEGLYDYELGFIEAMSYKSDSEKKAKMQKVITGLIMDVSDKMKGFSLDETKEYYQDIIERAWQQVKDAETPELKGEKLDDIFGWIILDQDVEKKTGETWSGAPVYLPTWWWRTMPYDRRPIPSSSSRVPAPASIPSSGMPSQPTAMPTLPGADFARSITDSVRNFSEGVVGEVRSFTNSVTRVTNPVVSRSGSSNRRGGSGRSGGMSCACACACAGCACACAGGGSGR